MTRRNRPLNLICSVQGSTALADERVPIVSGGAALVARGEDGRRQVLLIKRSDSYASTDISFLIHGLVRPLQLNNDIKSLEALVTARFESDRASMTIKELENYARLSNREVWETFFGLMIHYQVQRYYRTEEKRDAYMKVLDTVFNLPCIKGGAGTAKCVQDLAREELEKIRKRGDAYKPPSLWEFPKGSCDSGESFREAAWRKLYEETVFGYRRIGDVRGKRAPAVPDAFGQTSLTYTADDRMWNVKRVQVYFHDVGACRDFPAELGSYDGSNGTVTSLVDHKGQDVDDTKLKSWWRNQPHNQIWWWPIDDDLPLPEPARQALKAFAAPSRDSLNSGSGAAPTEDAKAKPEGKGEQGRPLIRHIVCFKYTSDAKMETIQHIESEFAKLEQKIEQVESFEKGTNCSSEGFNKGFQHVYVLTFASESARDAYLAHPAHLDFVKLVGQSVADVFVFDYLSQRA